ncbi:Down syndrome cell adhesion molecule-like protein Dscam2 [Nymphon striatum]|nr:Down syndrome cell adhesion molecule-like protein Dscam2 [Nymphon striatum]
MRCFSVINLSYGTHILLFTLLLRICVPRRILPMYNLSVSSATRIQGPLFIHEPPLKVEFMNDKGATVDCLAHGEPEPQIEWITDNGVKVHDSGWIRRVYNNGSMVLAPFSADQYRQEVHASVYKCTASNIHGRIVSSPVSIRAAIRQQQQQLQAQVYDVYVMRDNTAVLTCHIPTFLKDDLEVTSWVREDNFVIRKQPTRGLAILMGVYGIDSQRFEQNAAPKGQHIPIHRDPKYALAEDGKLYVSGVTSQDGGMNYWCRVHHKLSNETILSSTAGNIVITEPHRNLPLKITNIMSRMEVKAGTEFIVLPCAAQGYPPPTYRWLMKDQHGNEFAITAARQRHGNLIVKNIKDIGTKQYTCVAENNNHSVRKETSLLVTDKIRVHVEPQYLVVDSGQKVQLNCSTKGFPINSEVWKLNGKPVEFNSRVKSNSNILTVENIGPADEGMYQCFVSNDYDAAQGTAQIRLGAIPPRLIKTFSSRVLQPGPSIEIECSATGNPKPIVTWSTVGSTIEASSKYQIKEFYKDKVATTKLTIRNIRSRDGGDYTCTAQNKLGVTSHTDSINVYGLPLVHPIENATVGAGQNVVIKCYVSGYPIKFIKWRRKKPEIGTLSSPGKVEVGKLVTIVCTVKDGDEPIRISWLKDGLPLSVDLGIDFMEAKRFSYLQIREIKKDHSGNYSCTAKNMAGESSKTVNLDILIPPSWINTPGNVTATIGRRLLTLKCDANGWPRPAIKWIRTEGEVEIRNSDKYRLHPNGTLFINNIEKIDGGTYQCDVTNGVYPDLSGEVTLDVGTVPVIKEQEGRHSIVSYDNVTIQCSVSGTEPITIKWYKNGRDISKMNIGNRYVTNRTSTKDSIESRLSIEEATILDSGRFECKAFNKFGSDGSRQTLIVHEPVTTTTISTTTVSTTTETTTKQSTTMQSTDEKISTTIYSINDKASKTTIHQGMMIRKPKLNESVNDQKEKKSDNTLDSSMITDYGDNNDTFPLEIASKSFSVVTKENISAGSDVEVKSVGVNNFHILNTENNTLHLRIDQNSMTTLQLLLCFAARLSNCDHFHGYLFYKKAKEKDSEYCVISSPVRTSYESCRQKLLPTDSDSRYGKLEPSKIWSANKQLETGYEIPDYCKYFLFLQKSLNCILTTHTNPKMADWYGMNTTVSFYCSLAATDSENYPQSQQNLCRKKSNNLCRNILDAIILIVIVIKKENKYFVLFDVVTYLQITIIELEESSSRSSSRLDVQQLTYFEMRMMLKSHYIHKNKTFTCIKNILRKFKQRDGAKFSITMNEDKTNTIKHLIQNMKKAFTLPVSSFMKVPHNAYNDPERAPEAACSQEIQPAAFLSFFTILRHIVFGLPLFLLPGDVHFSAILFSLLDLF